jgi:hypothetical protein
MRLSFASGILCAGLIAVSCVQRDYNKAETKAVSNTKTMVKNPDGTFTVTCDWGAVENSVTAEQINKDDVCKGTQVNPMAFNAFLLWRDGKGTSILDYPAGYERHEGKIDPDGVFYVASSTYWQNDKFIGSLTEGAKVEADLLTYPTKEGRTLALRFSAPAEKKMTHANAVQHCKAKGLRLPHIQEIFDFCAAGTAKNAGGYYTNNRCADRLFWSASVNSDDRNYAWQFGGYYGYVDSIVDRGIDYGVRCVGLP